ncbi:MAG: polysaccharide deacetylase family protein [Acidobacteriota bacterium]
MKGRFPAPILMLHHVDSEPVEPVPVFPDSYLTPEDFEGLLDLLESRGSTVLSLSDAVGRWRRGEKLPRRAVVLTFDDGYRCFAEHAWPALRRRGWPATLFVVADLLGSTNLWDLEKGERQEELLDASALRQLAAEGVDIGCHSMTHADLSITDSEGISREISHAKKKLEDELGCPIDTFCYPYGRLSPAAAGAAREADFTAAVVIDAPSWAAPKDPFTLAREIITPRDSPFERKLKVSGGYRTWRKLPRLGILKALRNLAGR